MGRAHGIEVLTATVADGGAGSGASPTATRLEAMLNLVRGGATPRRAAYGVGIPSSTWHRWMAEAGVQPATGSYEPTNPRAPSHIREFWESVERARSQWVARVSIATTSGIPRNPIAGMKLLRQIDPEGQWGIDDEPTPRPGILASSAHTVERQVILLPEAAVRELLRQGLADATADQGDEEDDDPEPDLSGLAEIMVPPGARRP